MSGIPHGSAQLKRANDELDTRCRFADEAGAECGETESLSILEQFQRIYAERLKRLDGDGELAMHTLKSWVHDLTEQNAMLVRTVEELESELLKRVDLMHDQLRKTSLVVKRKEQLAKREKTEVELNLRQQVQLLQKDVSSLLDIINQSKQQGFCSIDNIKLHTISKSQLMDALPKREMQPSSPSEGGVGDMQNNVKVDSLKAQLADRDSEIQNLLERIEEMQNIYSLTLNQVKNAVETEKKCMQDLATSCRVLSRDSGDFPNASHTENNEVNMAPWVQERLKQQQEQITILISKARDLESNLNVVTRERDNLANELEASSRSHQSLNQAFTQTLSDPSMIILSKELETTRQQLAEASTHVKSLATCIKALEKKNNETQIALTGEVAEKHDQIVDLKKEAHQLEEQIKNANTQIIYRDSIIREMRNELKVARKKISSESNSDLDNKVKRKAFAAIPEASSVCDSGLDDGELSSSSHYLQAEIDLLRTQLKEQHKQILEKDEELSAQKQEVLRLEKHIGDQNKSKVKTITSPQLPAITLRELEEYRLCTVEGQAAVEELRDEIEAILSDIKIQEAKLLGIQLSAISASEKMQNSQQKLAQGSAYPATLVTIYDAVEDAKECIIDFQQRTDDFVRERRAGEQRRQSREKKVDKLQEQLETAHDNMRDGIESMEQALAERYEADRLSQPEYSDGSSYHSCRDSDSSSRIKQVERLEESNAELLSTLTTMERLKRDAEIKAAQCVQEVELMKAQISRRSFTEEMLHTKEQTIRELQGALDSTRRQVRDLQSEYERIARERDQTLKILEESANSGPLQVAELQSELARLRNQLSSLSSLQALVEQYERRLKDSSDQAERLSSQLNSVTLNLQAKEKMLSNKEEMVNILQDTLDRTHEELKLLKDKSGAASSVTALPDQDEASGTNGSVSDEVSGSSGVWGWARNTAARKHRVHDV